MNKARIGIIGVGWWGTVGHLEPLSDDSKTELVAVFSRTEAKARQRAERYGVPRHYTDYRKMIQECDLDGVIIATTPNVHYDQARYALEHGLHVLMEKPFVLKTEHVEELAHIAQKKGLLLSVCHPLLYNSLLAQAREQVRGGALGDVLLISAHFSQRTYDLYKGNAEQAFNRRTSDPDLPRPNPSSYSDPEIVGGGEGHTQASHLVGAILWLTGLQPVSAFAYMNNVDLDIDVVDAMTVRFRGGALATLSANGLLPPGIGASQILIQGNKGILSLDSMSRAAHIWLEGDEAPRKLELSDYRRSRARVPQNFVRAILGEEDLYVETDVAINEVRILDAAYCSVATGQPVEIVS